MLDRAQYDKFRVAPVDPETIRIAHIEHILTQLAAASSGRLTVEKFAESFENRPIFLATLGKGSRRVLLWSQMHGDEPTHTAVLLDLLSYLLQSPAPPSAEEILNNCTLLMLPLLNPDGAERFVRFNAQDIDVNRDARRLSTPEGRALHRAVETLRPEFGFNLHNQNARTAVGKPPKSAVASLLAPPPDEQRTETDAVRRAKQVAACFVSATRADVDHVDGMISKYDDTFEPRAFGDWIQSTGTATVLVEAGGWPAADSEPLVRLHFHGMLAALHAIATESYRQIDQAVYDALPFSNSNNLVDCLITGARIVDGEHGTEFVADVAINDSQGSRLNRTARRDGKIIDVGDLSVLAGKQAINAANCTVMPGRIVFLEDWNLVPPLSGERLDALLAAGVTTAIGMLATNRANIDVVDAIKNLPINWGFVVQIESGSNIVRLLDEISYAVSRGALAIVANQVESTNQKKIAHLRVPLLAIDKLTQASAVQGTERQIAQQVWQAHQLLNLNGRRGRIGRDFAADLQILAASNQSGSAPPAGDQLKRVLVAGETVWENGKRLGNNPGVFLRG